MLKKRNWLCLIKRLFFPETHNQHQQKKSKRKKWLFGRIRSKRLPPLAPPPPAEITKLDAEEKQSNFETNASKAISKCEVESKCLESITNRTETFPLNHQSEIIATTQHVSPDVGSREVQMYPTLPLTKDIQEVLPERPTKTQNHQCENHVRKLAAIKIQTSYRGYLARKALRALKGFVKLQAIIRGRAVRRQAMTTLKCLQAIVSIQSEVCTRRNELVHVKHRNLRLQGPSPTNEKPKTESPRRRRLDDRLLPKEEEIDILLRKKEAILRRQRTRAYSFNHRNSADSEDGKIEGRLRYWLQQHANDQAPTNDEKFGGKQLKLRSIEGLSQPHVLSLPRRSLHNHGKQSSHCEECLHPSSPTASIPTYMAATESAKAKTRSASTPRVRPMHFEAYSEGDSPYKHKISPMSSINSEVTCLSKSRSKPACSSQQKSPSFKGLPGSIRSSRNLKDVNLDSDSLLVVRKTR